MVIGSLSGIINGKTIELTEDIDLPQGAPVKVLVISEDWKAGDGLKASAGSWHELDEQEYQSWLAEMYAAREDSWRVAS